MRTRVFWSCFVSLSCVAGIYFVALGALLTLYPAMSPELPMREAFSWRFVTTCWLLAQPMIWLVSWLESRWIVRHIQSPIAAMIERGRNIREDRPAARSPQSHARNSSGLSNDVDELLSDLDQVVVGQYRFVADAAHELRTPLTAQSVVGESALARRASAAELREAICSMLEESRHMRQLIEGLLELTRASLVSTSSYSDKHEVTPLDLSELVNGCVQTLQVLAEERGQRFELALEGPVWVDADLTLVRQALLNVIHNAIEHCPPGTRILLETAQTADDGLIRVIDDGPGIELSEQARAFERFHRGAATAHRRGLGLGLSIARATLRSQGGHIHLYSTPGEGCCFILFLPLVLRPQVRLEQLVEAALLGRGIERSSASPQYRRQSSDDSALRTKARSS